MSTRWFGPRRLQPVSTDGYERIRIRPLSPTIGAEIEGIDLREPVDRATYFELRRALLAFKVIFLHDQDITPAQHVAFARLFGELEVHPFLPNREGFPEVIVFAKDENTKGYENTWHSDVTWRQEPSLGSVLRAREVPRVGGDTLFCDMHAAYEGLDDSLKATIDGLQAVHDFTRTFGSMLDAKTLAERQKEFPPALHPVVRTHPETGERAIYVNWPFTSHIVGMQRAESDRMLETLYRLADVPEYQCRFRWRKNSIAFWDNRAAQHYASSDYWPQVRVMERVTIVGDRPV